MSNNAIHGVSIENASVERDDYFFKRVQTIDRAAAAGRPIGGANGVRGLPPPRKHFKNLNCEEAFWCRINGFNSAIFNLKIRDDFLTLASQAEKQSGS